MSPWLAFLPAMLRPASASRGQQFRSENPSSMIIWFAWRTERSSSLCVGICARNMTCRPKNTGKNGGWSPTIPWLRRTMPRRVRGWRSKWDWDSNATTRPPRADSRHQFRMQRRGKTALSPSWNFGGRPEISTAQNRRLDRLPCVGASRLFASSRIYFKGSPALRVTGWELPEFAR